jgi:tRNA pseudouridine38-40 synthase
MNSTAGGTSSVAQRVKLVIAYDGTDYHGWQRQADGVITVQAVVEDAARRVLGEPVNLVGASRTDAGVHARGQVAHLSYARTIPAEKLASAINHRLPPDVVVTAARAVHAGFHATRDALTKLYRYAIHNDRQRPHDGASPRLLWHYRFPLDVTVMRAAAAAWVGRHDFAALASQGSPRQSTVRTVSHISIQRWGPRVTIDVMGDGFLYNQVRNMVGTLVEIGRGHWPVTRAAEILASGDRANAGPTAPPQGLCLQWIRYPCETEVTSWS